MKNYFYNFYKACQNLIKFKKLSKNDKQIVFYAETSADWVWLDLIIEHLSKLNKKVIRITSDPNDDYNSLKNVFYIGYGSPRTILFNTLDVKIFVMTLADLNSYYLKKSIHPVNYFYIFHSIMSTHRVYNEHAFDAYDTIFCTGNHQILEIRKTEKIYGLPKKNLEQHGYARLDSLINAKRNFKKLSTNKKKSISVLIAPSWGVGSLVNNNLDKIIQILIESNINVTLRLHPMTKRHYPNLSNQINKKYQSSGKFNFDSNIASVTSLVNADTMISEWSGSAFEYAFAMEKPVIFIDTDPKIHNPNWQKIQIPCFEEYTRSKVGKIISQNDLDKIPEVINQFLKHKEKWSSIISKLREQTVFNIGQSGKIGAELICKSLDKKN